MRVLPWGLLIASLLGTGCQQVEELVERLEKVVGDEEAVEGEEAGEDSPKPTASSECGGSDYPCAWTDVAPEIFARTDAVAQAAARAGTTVEAVTGYLRSQDDVVVLGTSDSVVRFRVAGGRGVWLFVAPKSGRATKGGALAMPAKPAPIVAWSPPAAATDEPPIGQNPPGERPRKRALILSPFSWQWNLDGGTNGDHTRTLAEVFAEVPDYADEGAVELIENPIETSFTQWPAGLDDFSGWEAYDAIHVSTHGSYACEESDGGGRCVTGLMTGDYLPILEVGSDELPDFMNAPAGIELGYLTVSEKERETVAETGVRTVEAQVSTVNADDRSAFVAGPFVTATSEYFEALYGSGLDDKIIFLDACTSAKSEDLVSALAGDDTVVLGWNKVVYASYSGGSSLVFWSQLLGVEATLISVKEGGVTVERAFEMLEKMDSDAELFRNGKLKSVVIEGSLAEDPASGGEIQIAGETDTRAREIIALVDPDDDYRRLGDGETVGFVGIPGDGKPDRLVLTAQLAGLSPDEDPSTYPIHVDVDGKTAEQSWTATTKLDEGVYVGTAEVDLGFDLKGPETLAVEPWVEIPTGGTSRWRHEDVGIEYFVLTASGPAFPTPQTFSIQPSQIRVFATNALSMLYVDRGLASATGQEALREGTAGSRRGASEDGSYVQQFSLQFDGMKTGRHPIGGSGEMDLGLHSQTGNPDGCPERAMPCRSIGLRETDGHLELTELVERGGLGRRSTRPKTVAGSFDVKFEQTNISHRGLPYRVKGSFRLEP